MYNNTTVVDGRDSEGLGLFPRNFPYLIIFYSTERQHAERVLLYMTFIMFCSEYHKRVKVTVVSE